MNLARDALKARNFEHLSEDPPLGAMLAAESSCGAAVDGAGRAVTALASSAPRDKWS
jgi:hypothetical protein